MTRLGPAAAVAVLVLAACGSDDAGPAETASEAAEVAASTEPLATDPAEPVPAADDNAGEDEPVETSPAQPEAVASSYDPGDLDPGTAVVVVDGNEFRFAHGDSMFDRCDLSPDFGFAGVEMDLADGSAEGGRHLVFNDDETGRLLTIGIPPETGFIAGAGEEIDRYLDQFDVDPPPLGATEVGDGTAVGITAMVNVFSGDVVEASFAIRCE